MKVKSFDSLTSILKISHLWYSIISMFKLKSTLKAVVSIEVIKAKFLSEVFYSTFGCTIYEGRFAFKCWTICTPRILLKNESHKLRTDHLFRYVADINIIFFAPLSQLIIPISFKIRNLKPLPYLSVVYWFQVRQGYDVHPRTLQALSIVVGGCWLAKSRTSCYTEYSYKWSSFILEMAEPFTHKAPKDSVEDEFLSHCIFYHT